MINSLISPFLLDGKKVAFGKTESDKSATREAQSGKLRRKKPLPKEKFYKLLRLRKRIRAIDPSFIKSKTCSVFYSELTHEDTGERRYRAIGCEERAVCPICGGSYWRIKGKEARSLFNKLSRACYDVLGKTLGGDIGGVAILHFWHSKKPLLPHYHLHLIVSPYTEDGRLVLNNPLLLKDQLAGMREAWREAVSGIFGIGFKGSFDVHYEFIQENKKTNYEQVRAKFYHRFNYALRHWSEDLLKYRGKVDRKNLTPAIKRAKELEGITKIRWFGYLSPTRRGKAGFELVHYMSELTVCPECHREFNTEDLLDTLRLLGGQVLCLCGHRFEEAELGKKSMWHKTGKTFILKHFREDGVIFAEWDEVKKRIVKGTERLVPYDKVGLFPSKGKKKRFVCRDP